MLEALTALLEEKEGTGGLGSTGRSLRRLHRQQQRVLDQPAQVVKEYVEETMQRAGAEAGDVWRVYHYNEKISWGRFKGIQKMHFHTSHILDLLLRNRPDQAAAYCCQLCRALHQVSLDQGGWDAASLLLPRQDPLTRIRFGGSAAEMEVVANYRDTIRKLEKAHSEAGKTKKEKGDDGNGQ